MKNVDIYPFVSQRKLSQLLHQMHVSVSLSLCETFCKSVVEAMAMGIPAIIPNDIACFKEMFENMDGVVFTERNSKSFVAAIEALTENENMYKKMCIASHIATTKYASSHVLPLLHCSLLNIQEGSNG